MSCICYHVVSQKFTSGIQYLASVIMQFQNIHQWDIVSCICYRVVSQRFSKGIQCLASVIVQFRKDSPEGYSVLYLLSCSFAKIHQRDIVSRICYHVVSQRFTRGIQCLASVIMYYHKDTPGGYIVLHLLSCSFTKIPQRDVVSCICYHVVSQRFTRRILCPGSVSMQFHKYSPEGNSVLHLLSCSFAKIHQTDLVSCICQHVVSQIFTRGIQCLASVIMYYHKDSPGGYILLHLLSCSFTKIHQCDIVPCTCYHVVSPRFTRGIQCLASVLMQFRKDSPEGFSVLHLLACSFTIIQQRDIVSCICYHVVSQRFIRRIQCLASVSMLFHKYSPEGYSVLHVLSWGFTKIDRTDIVSCIYYHLLSQRFTRGIYCLASVIVQFHKDSPEGYSALHLLSCLFHQDSPEVYSVLHLLSCSFAKIHQRDLVSCICQHVVSQIFTRGIQCLASVIMQFHKGSPEEYSVLHLFSCSFTMIHQRDIVSCICYHELSQRFSWGIYCLASVIMQFHKDSPEGYCVLHLLACSFTNIHQREIVSCICCHVVSQRFTRGMWCLASVSMQFHKYSAEGYSVLHLLSCSFTKIHQWYIVSCICYHVVSKYSPVGYSVLHLLSCSSTKILQRDIVSCICYRVVSQRFSRGIQCLSFIIMQFRKYPPEGYIVLHMLSSYPGA